MSIRPKWLRDLCSILFSAYYILYANEADEKVKPVECIYRPNEILMILSLVAAQISSCANRRDTAYYLGEVNKSLCPFHSRSNTRIRHYFVRVQIRMVVRLPSVSVRRKILLPRPKSSKYTRPISAYLFFEPRETELCHTTDLILDLPGGGFVAMSPEHHEERLRAWAITTGKPVLSIDYGKAPECTYICGPRLPLWLVLNSSSDPYPFAIDEAYDTYRTLVESGLFLLATIKRGDSYNFCRWDCDRPGWRQPQRHHNGGFCVCSSLLYLHAS